MKFLYECGAIAEYGIEDACGHTSGRPFSEDPDEMKQILLDMGWEPEWEAVYMSGGSAEPMIRSKMRDQLREQEAAWKPLWTKQGRRQRRHDTFGQHDAFQDCRAEGLRSNICSCGLQIIIGGFNRVAWRGE